MAKRLAKVPKRLLKRFPNLRPMPECKVCGNGDRLEPGGPCCPKCGTPPICCEPGGCPEHRKEKRG